MSEATLPYEILEVPAPDGGVRLVLRIEGQPVATASATADVLDAMERHLGETRAAVEATLRDSLVDFLKHRLDKVTITEPQEDPLCPLRFRSAYTYRDFDDIAVGLVWYDVQRSETWPDEVPAMARNRMRHEVHRLLTSDGSRARELVELPQQRGEHELAR